MLQQTAVAQSAYKESSNSFARYTQSGDMKNLQEAKKQIDKAYKTKRDSASTRVNIMRALIYSSLAYIDSNRTVGYDKDPIDETYHSLELINAKNNYYGSEIRYVKQNLKAALIHQANKALNENEFDQAYSSFSRVHKLMPNNSEVLNNLALMAFQADKYEESIEYYKQILNAEWASPEHYQQLAEIYKRSENLQEQINVLEEGSQRFPDSKALIFELVDLYAKNKIYGALINRIDKALNFEPENIDLLYLAGFANQKQKNTEKAQRYYEQIISLDQNNYEANLALGLIALNKYLKDEEDYETQYEAQDYLLKANEIRPYEVNALRSLALYYEKSGDEVQLDRVNLLLNQLTNNL